VVVALVVVGIAAAVLLTLRAGTDDSASGDGSQVTTTAALEGPAGELVGLLANSGAVNFDVAYTVSDPARGAGATAHLWRRPPLARLDTQSGTGDSVRRDSSMLTASGPVRCSSLATGPWTCAPSPGLDLRTLSVVPPALAAQLGGLDVSVADATVAGEEVRCFTLAPRPGTSVSGDSRPGEVCLTPDGIAARVAAGATRLEMTSLQRGRMPDEVFEPPASVGG